MGRVFIPGFRKIETSSSGEGGTTNYNDLTNKPSINNVPLVGNLKTVDLKLTDATLTEEGVPAEAKIVGTKLEEQSTSLTALSEQLGNHTVKSDVPENAVFTDTLYDDTEVKESIAELNSNLDVLEFDELSGGKNLLKTNNASITSAGNFIYEEIILNAGSYVISYTPSVSCDCQIQVYDSNNNVLFNSSGFRVTENQRDSKGFTISSNSARIEFYANSSTGGTLSNIMLESGTVLHDYEPYIPSVKMIADEVSAQNESLADYGLDNKCNSLEQGYATWWDANVEQSPDYIHTDFISVSNGDLITIKGGLNASHVIFYNDSKEFISFETGVNKVSVPSGVAFVRANFHGSGITPNNVNIGIYVENQIDVIKNDLDALEFGEVAGGKNLLKESTLYITNESKSITDYDMPVGTYTISFYSNIGGAVDFYGSQDSSIIGGGGCAITPGGRSTKTFTVNTPSKLMCYANVSTTITDIQIEEGETATEYEPYIPSVKMLAEEVSTQNESLSVIGKCKNLLKPTLQTTTQNGVTCTANGDGTYTLNGTATSNIWFTLGKAKLYSGKTYRLCGLNKVGNSTLYIQLRNGNIITQTTNNGIDLSITETSENYLVVAFIPETTTYNNIIYKPMITEDLTVTYDDFVPYTGDGDTLIHDVAELKDDLDKLNSLPIGSIIQIEAAKDNIETTTQKYGWQYLGTSNIECNDGSVKLLVTNVYRKNN